MIILLALGAWQTQRLIWKGELNAFRAEQSAAEPIALPRTVEDLSALAFRPIWVEGTFRHDQEMYLGARTHIGRAGFQVITPLERADGSVVLINRGWIPLESKAPESRAAGQVAGVVRIEGFAVPGGQQGWFVADNEPEQRFWYWRDLASLSDAAGIPQQSFMIDAGPAPNPGGLPIGGQTRLELRNEHLQYAIIWYALSLSLVGVYLIYMRRERPPSGENTE